MLQVAYPEALKLLMVMAQAPCGLVFDDLMLFAQLQNL